MKTIQVGKTPINQESTASVVKDLPADYRQFYKGVSAFGGSPAASAVSKEQFLANPSAYKAPSVSSVLGSYNINNYSTPAPGIYGGGMGGNSAIGMGGRPAIGIGGYTPPKTAAQLAEEQYSAYVSGVDSANATSRSNDLVNYLKSANPSIAPTQFAQYWSNGQGQTPIRDRMPSAGGANFADMYLNGQSPDEFYASRPDLVSTVHEGTGVSLGAAGLNMAGGRAGMTADTNTGSASGFSSTGMGGGSISNSGFGDGAAKGGSLGGLDSSSAPATPRTPEIKGPAYATGGVIGQQPLGNAQQPQQGGNPQGLIDEASQDLIRRNPQAVQQIKQLIDEAISSGEVSPQQMQTAVQMAQAALNNPSLWPQLKRWAEEQGIADPGDLPPQFDKGLVSMILLVAKTYTHADAGMQGAPQGAPQQSLASGGMIRGPGTGTSDSVPAINTSNGQKVAVSNGEFVIPANVVAAKGTDFFEALVNKYSPDQQGA